MKLKILFLVFIGFVSCVEKITENEPVVKIYQDGKCRNYGLNKINNDSLCFDYKFDKSLSINFCVKGNCCPDSNRFIFNYKLI